MEYEKLREMEKTHVCAECGGEPVTVWDADNDTHRLACGNNKSHNGFKRRSSQLTALKRGDFDKVAGPGAQADLERRARKSQLAFSKLPQEDLGDSHHLTLAEAESLVEWADMVGLNVYLGHVDLYYGKPRPSVDGYYYLAKKRDRNISVLAQPATAQDYELYKVDKADYFFIARGWENQAETKEIGLGIVRLDEIAEMSKKNPDHKRHSVVARYPERTAEHRAEWQLLRKLIPLEIKSSDNNLPRTPS